ncbi:hypothetical protein BGZ46_002733 [Entomortierella lignicola]|nr:hypothetical protein BGZ46_002733 [Entomortierella lignicola]
MFIAFSDYDVEPLPPNSTEHIREAVDLSDLLKVLASRIEDFKGLLVVPRSVNGPTETSIGRQVPLGFERLKICEMFAELLHCSNMAVLNSRPIITVFPDGTVKVPTVKTEEPFIHHSQTVKEEMEAAKVEPVEENDRPNDVDQEMKESTPDKDDDKNVEENKENKENKDVEENKIVEDDKIETDLEQGLATPKSAPKNSAQQLEDATAALGLEDQATPRASPPPSLTVEEIASDPATPTSTAQGTVQIPVGDFLKMQFVDHHIIPTCFDLFFQFPWNNFLHTVVYDMVHQVFHRPMGDIGRPGIDGTYIPPSSDHGVTEGWNRRLTISIFKDGKLTKRITDAQRLCDFECSQPKGVRLGYMGHLTYIADETVKLLELYSQTSLLPTLYEFIELEDWWSYVSKVLKETKERDAQVLGGSRPNVMEPHKSLDEVQDDDFMDDHGDDYGSNSGFLGGDAVVSHEGDTASDQFARYLSQQITNNRPEKFGSSDEDEDDEEGNWIGEYGPDTDFERRRAAAATGLDDPFGNRHTMDFDDSDDDEGADEEVWNSSWPNTFGETKVSELGSTTQFNANLTDWSEDFQDGFTEFKSATAGEDGKDEFDFPPFSVEQSKSTDGTATNTNEANPFGDDNVESSSSGGSESATKEEETLNKEIDTLKSKDVDVNMEAVVLAPEVREAPEIEETVTENVETTTTVQGEEKEKTTGSTVEIEVVPLVDSGTGKLKETETTATTTTTITTESDPIPEKETTVETSKSEGDEIDTTEKKH